MELSDKIRAIEEQLDNLLDQIDTCLETKKGSNITNEENVVTEDKTLSELFLQIQSSREEILQNKDFAVFYNALQNNRALIENYSTYANTALNIRDKAKIIFIIKTDLLSIKNKVDSIKNLNKKLESLQGLQVTI